MKDKKLTSTANRSTSVQKPSSSSDIAAFIKASKEAGLAQSGRLIFALDATFSRQPTWDRAMDIQASMFDAVGKAGGLSVQLIYFRGMDECRASKWVINSDALRQLMLAIKCRGGHTQIAKILNHTSSESTRQKVSALVFIGDAIEENVDELCAIAGELGLKGVRCFFFQEGHDLRVEHAFREMARLTAGAYFRLGPDSAKELAELLGAVAVYARGGLKALSNRGGNTARLLLEQMEK